MANEKLNFNVINSAGGWTGPIANIDEAIADADGSLISATNKDDAADLGLTDSAVIDADTVTAVDIVVRALTTGAGADTLGVELLIGGVVQGTQQISAALTGSFVNYSFSDAAWDSDWTAAQMDGMEVRVTALQSQMPTTVGHRIDCGDVDIVYTPDAGGDVTLTADPGSLALTGATAVFETTLAAAAGSLALTGAEATFEIATVLDGQPGSLVLSGATAGFETTLDAQPGSLVLSGAVANFEIATVLDAQPGSLVLSGADADFIISLAADPGSLVLSGADATFDISGGAPPVIARRGGRFIFDKEPEALQELIELVEPVIVPVLDIKQTPSSLEAAILKRPALRIPAKKKLRVEQLLAEAGLTLEELLIIID